MLFKNAGCSRTTTEMTSSTTQFFTVQSRIGSSHPHRFQIWEPRAFHVHKSLKYIEVSFIQHMIHKGRQFSQYNRAIQHVTHRSESWSWGSRRSWGSPGAWVTLSTVSLYAWDSLRQFLFYILYWTLCMFTVIRWATLSPLGPGSPGVPGKPGGPSGPCV